MDKKRILITGAAGFIGSNFVHFLLNKNNEGESWDITGVDDLSNGHMEFLNGALDKIKFHQCGFAATKILKKTVQGEFDYIFHFAAIPRVAYSVENPHTTNSINVNETLYLMNAAKEGKVKRFIFSSSSSVYGNIEIFPTPEDHPKNPRSPYALQKSIIEDYCKLFYDLYGFDSVCLRYFNVVGPNCYGDSPYSTAVAAWLDKIMNGGQLRSDGDGEQIRDLCPVSNVVFANYLAAKHEDNLKASCFNVCCERTVSNNDILNYLMKAFPEINDKRIDRAPSRPGDVVKTYGSIQKIKEVLGYEVQDYFWDYLPNIINWWKELKK